MHRQYVHIDSRTIAYFDSAPGNKDAPVAVLIHAFPLGASMWEAQFKAAPDGWRLIAPDVRGFGGSTLPEVDDSVPAIDDYAADVVDLLGELGMHSVVLGGLSMGGYITFAIIRRAPQLLRALVLADTRADADSPQGRANRRNMLALLDREGPSGIARELMPKLLGSTTLETRPEVESGVRRLIKQQSAQALRGAIVRMMERPDSAAVVTTISVPTLVIVGEEDVLTPIADSRKLADAVPASELVIVPRAGHLSNMEQPKPFNDAIATFLSRL